MPTEPNHLRRLAQRAVATRPRLLLATALAEYPDDGLAAQLGCPVAAVVRLRCCRPPRPAHWAADVQAIAAAVGADAGALAALLGGQRTGTSELGGP
jgi:hypothetical protein